MFNLSAMASNMLNSIDSVAKETLEETASSVMQNKNRNRRQNIAENASLSSINSGDFFDDNVNGHPTNEGSSIRSHISNDNLNVHSSHSNSDFNRHISDDFTIGTPEKPSQSIDSSTSHVSGVFRPPVAPSSSSNAPSSHGKTILVASAADIDQETKKALRKQKKEIDDLYADIAHFETECSNLREEVKEAWANYKQAQEKAALVVSDLRDDMRDLQNAKYAEKQQAVAQIVQLTEAVNTAQQQVSAAQCERDELRILLQAAIEKDNAWIAQVSALNEELQDAKASTVQGVHNLREELKASQHAAEQMRHDHNAVIRQNQLRLSQLENENSELLRALAVSQRELAIVKSGGADQITSQPAIDYLSRDYINVQQEVIKLSAELESEREARLDSERRVKQLECEARAIQLNFDDERKRNASTVTDMSTQIAVLEDKLRDMKRNNELSAHRVGGVFSGSIGGYEQQRGSETSSSNLSEQQTDNYCHRLEAELASCKEHVQDLSRKLLKKEGTVVDLQAERAALNAKNADLLSRCNKAERSLSALRDLEDGGGGDDDDHSAYHSGDDLVNNNNHSSGEAREGTSLLRRGGVKSSSTAGGSTTRVLSDLEKIGVKPGARVANAVNMIDAWTMLTGRFLRSYPLVRLGFVLYLVLLHVWVFFILVMHMETLEMDTEEQQQQLLHPQ